MDLPFSEIDNGELDELFPKPYFPEEYEVGYDADGNEWVHARGVWYPCLENIYQDIEEREQDERDQYINEDQAEDEDQAENRMTFDEWIDMYPEWRCAFIQDIPPPPSPLVRQTNERRACDVFGVSWTVDIDQDDQDEDDEDDQDDEDEDDQDDEDQDQDEDYNLEDLD